MGDREDAQAHLVGGALAPHDVPVGLALEGRELVAQPLHVAAGDLHGLARVSVTGLIGLAAWLSKSQTGMSRMVRARGVPGSTWILIDAAEQVHVAGDGPDRRRSGAWCGCRW